MNKRQLAGVYLSVFALIAADTSYQGVERSRDNHRWCHLLSTLDAPSVPPSNPRGVVIQREIHELKISYDC